MITVLDNNAIDANDIIYYKGNSGYFHYYAMFVKRGIEFKIGASFEQKPIGRPRSSTKVKKTVYVEKERLQELIEFVLILNKK